MLQWTNVEQAAYDAFKKELTIAPILTQADPAPPYILKTESTVALQSEDRC